MALQFVQQHAQININNNNNNNNGNDNGIKSINKNIYNKIDRSHIDIDNNYINNNVVNKAK